MNTTQYAFLTKTLVDDAMGRKPADLVIRDGRWVNVQSAEIVAKKTEKGLEGFRACGCSLHNPNMQLSLLPLVVIPELRISDLGLVDVTRFDFIPLIEPGNEK